MFVPATILSSLCTGLYSISWQFDPCCKYQVENSGNHLEQLALGGLNSASPVVLVRRDDTRRKILHTAVTAACISQTMLRLYFPYLNTWFGRNSSGMGSGNQIAPSIATNRLVISELREFQQPIAHTLNNSAQFMSNLFGGGLNLL